MEFNKTIENLFECGGGIDRNIISRIANQQKEKLVGGIGDGRDIEEFDPVQVVKGVKVEMEHTNDVKSVLEIVADHLTEDPLYYDKLQQVERH